MAQYNEVLIRQKLLSQRAELEHDIYERTWGAEAVVPTDPMLDSGGMTSEQADDADAMSNAERNQALVRNSQALLGQINAALERLDSGTYGTCVRCGREINPRRLEALPYATLCIDCQAATEQHLAE